MLVPALFAAPAAAQLPAALGPDGRVFSLLGGGRDLARGGPPLDRARGELPARGAAAGRRGRGHPARGGAPVARGGRRADARAAPRPRPPRRRLRARRDRAGGLRGPPVSACGRIAAAGTSSSTPARRCPGGWAATRSRAARRVPGGGFAFTLGPDGAAGGSPRARHGRARCRSAGDRGPSPCCRAVGRRARGRRREQRRRHAAHGRGPAARRCAPSPAPGEVAALGSRRCRTARCCARAAARHPRPDGPLRGKARTRRPARLGDGGASSDAGMVSARSASRQRPTGRCS